MIYNTCCFVSLLILIMLQKPVGVSESESDTSIVRYVRCIVIFCMLEVILVFVLLPGISNMQRL